MKNLRFKTLSLLMLVTLATCSLQAQGTVYLSNLDAPSTGIPGNGWQGSVTSVSPNGLASWQFQSGNAQFALNATAIPEPSALSLLAIIGVPAFFLRRFQQGRTP